MCSQIVFDECHKAKNLAGTEGKSSKTGQAVLRLQELLQKARIVYCSATGSSLAHLYNTDFHYKQGNE